MKKLFTLLAVIFCLTSLRAQFVTIPDANFLTWLQTNVPTAMNGNQMDTTSMAVTLRTRIDIENLGITDLTGAQYFDSLKVLDCGNGQLSLTPNNLTSLPKLPITLDTLICGRNLLTFLPNLTATLKYLSCYHNQLNSLPNLSNTITRIDCSYNQISSLPALPTQLYYFNCSYNQIVTLPSLPNNLAELECDGNLLTNFPSLPNSLISLQCINNQLTNLPALPNLLSTLICMENSLTTLPILPNSLLFLYCSSNSLTSLPALPNNIISLSCDYNQIITLPALPTSLQVLQCSNNNISCFPKFNSSLTALDIFSNPFSCLPNYISAMDAITLAYPLCAPGNTNNCSSSEGVFGLIYKDNNSDCIKNNGDNGLKNIPLKIYDTSNNLLGETSTALNGVYSFSQTANTYSVVVDTAAMPFVSQCNYPGIDSTVTVALLDTNINFALTCKPGLDIGIQSITTTGIIFPGQPHTLNINAGDMSRWYNLNCAAGFSGTLSFTISGPIAYIGSAFGALTPSVTGNIYTYNIADFGTINNTTDFNLVFQTDTTAQAGDNICISATITPIISDYTPSNNIYNYCYQVVNSYDPNIKEVYPIDVQPGFNDWLTYTIHFQNTGNAPAYNIRLTDTLDTMFDLETFQVINYSHLNNTSVNGNILNVRFPNIMLPDSTSNPSGSIGYIQYRIKPKVTWAAPYKIKNTAYIYFDYNSPIVTNSTYNSILVPTGLNNQSNTLAALYPNPTNGRFTVELNSKEKQSLQVFDISGQMVLSQTIENGKASIDANYLAAGIYNISIKGAASITNKKLVIVK